MFRGFTLIELLVSMVVIAVIGTVIVSIFFSVLRGTNKTNTLIKVRQNGSYAISQISKVVREAKTLDYPASCDASPTDSRIEITTLNNTRYQFSCSNNTIEKNTIPATTAERLTDTATVSIPAASCSFSCTQGDTSNTKVVSVSFVVEQAGESVDENEAKVSFQTSVALRNSQ